MSIRIRRTAITTLSAAQIAVALSCLEDSVAIGDAATNDKVEVDDVGGEKALKVSVIASVGGGGGGTASTDKSAFTAGAVDFTPIGGEYDADGSADLVDGEMGMARITAERSLHVNLAESAISLATSTKQDTIIGHVDGIEGLLTTIDADTSALAACAAGTELQVDIVTSALPSGAATSAKQDTMITSLQLIDDVIFTDDAAFTPAASKVLAIGAEADEAATDSVDEGDIGALRMTTDRMLYVKVGANTTDYATQTTLALMKTALDSLLTSSQLIDDTIFVDDAGFTAAASKVKMIGGQYQSTPNALDDGDAGSILLDANHAVQVVLRAGTAAFGKLAANSGVDIGDVDVTSIVMPTGASAAQVQGTVAHGTATAQNPVMVGAEARTTALNTAESAGDVVRQIGDEYGRQITAGRFAPQMIGFQAPSAITNTSETTVITADANNCLDIIWFSITNNSTVDSLATLKDSTGGTTRWIGLIPKGGGIVVCPSTPIPQATKNNNWTLTMGTTATSTNFSAMFGKRPT